MELKKVIEILKDKIYNTCFACPEDKQALQTAISHLETLQKVKEMGGVKRKEIPEREDYTGNSDDAYDNGSEIGGAFSFNYALDLIHAELAGKLEGLEELLKDLIGEYFDLAGWQDKAAYKKLSNKIQELILVKKEG